VTPFSRRVLAAVALLVCCAAAAQQTPPLTSPQQAAPGTSALSDPIPDIHSVIARVRARYVALETLRKSYICTMTQVADEFSSNGSKKTHTDQYQAFYVNNTQILQHISHDGQPLSPEDAKKEQERVDKVVAKLKSHQNKAAKDEVQLSAGGLLKVATFANPRREIINGRPTLVFDYQGNPDAKANDLGDEIMRLLAGTLWVDERDNAILRLNGSLQQNFHVGGGLLVNIKKGSWFDFTQMPVNGEIWFPAQFTVHVDGRFLLVKGFNGAGRDTFSDYRRMKTSVTILPGTQLLEAPSSDLPPAAPALPTPPKS
jgi:hypothetical protein